MKYCECGDNTIILHFLLRLIINTPPAYTHLFTRVQGASPA